ncbi:MAG: 2-phospho-L-lactate guanylyltransferase [Deltaproteobacteria bacterium]
MRLGSGAMNAALVPVRSITGAKKRLAKTLAAEARERLALTMLESMLTAIAQARTVDRVYVVSADRRLLEHASAHGAELIEEGRPQGLNAAVALAARKIESEGATRLLTIPGDVPLLEPTELDRLMATDPDRYPVVLVPSTSGTGTNALLTSPPTVLASRFEGLSLAAHRKACDEMDIPYLVMELPGFALDVDTADDLALLDRSTRNVA